MNLSEPKQTVRKRHLLQYSPCFALFCLFFLTSLQLFAATGSMRDELLRLQQLSESHPDQALSQLQTLQQQSPASTAEADLRDLILMQIPLYIDKGDKKQAMALITRLAQIGSQSHDQIARVMALNFQAKMLSDEGKYGEGLALIEPTLASVKQSNNNLLNNQIESTAGDLYSSIGNFQVALQHQLSALESLDAIKESNWVTDLNRGKTLNYIGRLYLSLKDDEMALSYLAKARDLAQRLDSPALMSSIANNSGYAYADQEKWQLAINAYKDSLSIARQVGNRSSEAKSLNNLADASLNIGNYPDCVRYAQQSIQIAHADGLSNIDAIAQTNLGICHIYMGELEKGVAEDKLGMEFAKTSQAKPMLEGMLSDLSTAYEKAGRYQDALKTLQEKDQLTSELFLAAREHAMIEMKVHFDLSQRQKEIEKLEQQNLLQHVEIDNKNLQRIISIFTIATVFIAAVGVFFLYKRVRRTNLRLRAANQKLQIQSTRDPLTGLLNRRAFQTVIESFNQENERRNDSVEGVHDVLVLLDIDHFKHINDTYGHPVGDLVLVELGQRLQKILRDKDMLMRWGGEEFLIYLYRVPTDKVAQIVQRELAVVGSTPIRQKEANAQPISVTVSAGYILMPLPGIGESELGWENALQLVDLALYTAKTNGRNQAVGLESVHGSREQIDALIAGDLQGAIDSQIIELQYIKGV